MRVLRIFLCVAVCWSSQFLPAQHCGGTERWAVKDGTDPAAPQIDFANITPMTVAQLLQLPQPHLPNNNTTRVVPDETHLYRVTARLMQWRHECCQATDDSDYHLVMTDDTQQFSDENNGVPVTGHSFVAEIPDIRCLSGRSGQFGTTSPFLPDPNDGDPPSPLSIREARAALEQATPNANLNGGWNSMNGIPVEIVGVGFFDKAHGQTGRAPNNIEIHPVLAISFNPGAGPQPGPTPGPAPVPGPAPQPGPQPPGTVLQWEYRTITAATADNLTGQANTLGLQGWELVSVVLDTSRPDKYVGYLKRKK